MRNFLIVLSLVLAGCTGNEYVATVTPVTLPPPPPAQHVPEIADLKLSPDSVMHMEGDGTVVVTVEVTFWDAALDIDSLWIRLPDGTTIEFDVSVTTERGTFTQEFVASTERIGEISFDFWLVDEAGNSSFDSPAVLNVLWNVQSSDWTNRLDALPTLHDVTWDGTAFIAVGNEGTVLTSADGIDWTERETGTEANLYAIAADGEDIFAGGDEIVLTSTDHGENWIVKHRPEYIGVTAVAVNSSKVVVGGIVGDLFSSVVMISEDRGDSWEQVGFPLFGLPFSDVIFRDGLFVAPTDCCFSLNGARVQVSADGRTWNEVVLREEGAGLLAVVHDGSQFIVSGGNGAVYSSFDGYNWTEWQTPVEEVEYFSSVWTGSKLVLAGGPPRWYWMHGGPPSVVWPTGISSTDGGLTWDTFHIDGLYQSFGLAFGNGRLVSVGQTTPDSAEGAIYTTD